MSQKYFDIGKCIYCGTQEGKLTTEHIIPFGLGGKLTLENSCCESCRRITSKCELNPIRENWEHVRAYRNYPSRRRKFDKEKFDLNVVFKDGTEGVLKVSKDELMAITPFLEYKLPAVLRGYKEKRGIEINAVSHYIFGVDAENFAQKYNVKSFSIKSEHKGNSFEIMLAKIAYCFAIACLGVGCFKEIFVLPAILGQKDDIGLWVGCDHSGVVVPLLGKQQSECAAKVFVKNFENSSDQFLVVRLKFFANTDTPEYIVIVGMLKDNCSTLHKAS